MKKIYFILTAAAGLLLTGCASDDLVALENDVPVVEETGAPIVFGSVKKGMTRADLEGADAAKKLGYKFVVGGKKGSTTAATNGKVVFDNYLVEYEENTANTTQSNSSNWEYVGKGLIDHASGHGITSQTIKYWDYSEAQYDFIAWSTGSKTPIYTEPSTGIPAGSVLVSAIDPNATATAAYTFTGKAADLRECYIADLVTVKKSEYGKQDANNPVTFSFRQLGTKVRIGLYETIPGYSVKNVKFYTQGGILTDPSTEIVNNATLFTTTANKIFTEGTYTVTFPTVDGTTADNNQAHVTFAPKSSVDQTTIVDWGGLNYTIAEEGEQTAGNVFLGRTSNTASFAGNADDDYYVIYLPNEDGTNLNLRVDFTLESIDGGGEIIEVKNAKAQVPSIYTTWKPGFAYTYLFKISDKTNGRTGVYDPTKADDATINSDPAGLYPITFDAVVVNAEEDATQETITTVMTPSITSYQQKSTVVNADEYTANGNDIFVTVNEGDALVTMTNENPVVDGDAALYTIPAGKTEAEVVDALQMQDDNAGEFTIKGRSGLGLKAATFTLTNSVEFGADGNAISVAANQALRFTPTSGTTYAFVYTKKAATSTTDKFQPVTKADNASVSGLYRYAYKDAPVGDVQQGTIYFADETSHMITPFIGQGVSNLYTATHDPATGYAVTGTGYYYTLDNGQSYQACAEVAYADFATATDLYTFDGTNYTSKTDSDPQDGTAYYKKVGSSYIYCVIYPQQADGLKVIDEAVNKVPCGTTDVAYKGMTYFDKYVKNDGEYYTKVIKVQ